MRTLDLTRSYGRVHPPTPVPGTNRVQYFEQDGLAFDHAGHEIIKGATAPEEPAPSAAPQKLTPAVLRHLERLAANGPKMPLGSLHREAGLVLGDACPTTKPEIIAALKATLTVHRARA